MEMRLRVKRFGESEKGNLKFEEGKGWCERRRGRRRREGEEEWVIR